MEHERNNTQAKVIEQQACKAHIIKQMAASVHSSEHNEATSSK